MIRLACPGCGAKYKVEDARAGKATRCKRCRSKFIVPFTDPPGTYPAPGGADLKRSSPFDPVGSRPLPTLPAPDLPKHASLVVNDEWATPPSGTPRPPELPPKPQGVEIAPCPGCHAQLTVAPDSLGSNVECPYCHTIFAAVRPGAIVVPPTHTAVVAPEPSRWVDAEPAPRPIRRGRVKVGGRRTIASIGVLSAAKMAGATSFVSGLLVSLIYGFFAFVIFLIGSSAGGDVGGLIGFGVMYVVCSLILYPIILGVSGFLSGAVGALIYNLLATVIGGVEVDLE